MEINVRIRNAGHSMSEKLSASPGEAYAQRLGWLAAGWDEYSEDGNEWKALDPDPQVITRSTPMKTGPVHFSAHSVEMIWKAYAETLTEIRTGTKTMSDALRKMERDVECASPETTPSLATLAADLETARARGRTLREMLILMGVIL